jgi:ABC-type branched-subunit amino acid transport system ATPase component/ABC-type branched-subunit amino acid transport system permease subunit
VLLASAWITKQVVFDGLVNGLVIGLVAIGIVLIYRATRVINFAVGNMGLVAAGLFSLLVVQYHVPFWVGLPLAVALGILFAIVIEMAVIRRLFTAPRVIVLVATIGIAQLALTVATAYPKITNGAARYPVALSSTWSVGGLQVTGPQLSIIVIAPVAVLLLTWFLARTDIGKTVKASASNADLARISGVNPKLVSTMVWAIAGALSSVSLILIAGQSGTAGSITTLGPDTLVRALAAAVIGGMQSFRRTMIAAVGIGMAQAVVGFNYLNQTGLIDLLILGAILIAVFFQSRDRGEEPAGHYSFAAKPRPVPERLRNIWWIRLLDRSGLIVLGVVAIVLPIIVTEPSRHQLYALILGYAICGTSVTILTGWAGQVSLGQMAFAGIGALTAASLRQGISIDIGWHHTRILNTSFTGEPFWVAIVIATVITAALAAVIGIGSLRVRGLLLAVTTFAFALAAQQYLYNRPILNGHSDSAELFPRGKLFGIDFTSERSYYYAVLVILVLVLALVARFRRTGVGRSMIAVRDNADSASGFTVSPTRAKMQAFALAGGIAGLGGALLSGALQQVPFSEEFYLVNDSLVLVSLVVIGGMGSTIGPVLGALWIVGLPSFDPSNALVGLLASSLGLLVLLLYFPTGLVGMAHRLREVVIDWADRRTPQAPVAKPAAVPATAVRRPDRPALQGAALEASHMVVRFGGLVAVDGASIRVDADEIVGLIGANGAGKSTLMNAIGGYVASRGTVHLMGTDVSGRSPQVRARYGLGRTFQAARLFPELTVRETVQVALESQKRTGLLSTAFVLPHQFRAERAKRSEAAEILGFLGLGRYAEHYVSDLSTGTRRIVEIACLLAMSARMLCLDEPTAGVAQRETEAFGPLLVEVRRELGASMLVIEHDMPLIMGISDRVYCLEAGKIIAEGNPSAVRNDPKVIASYLGTDERAIARSGTAPSEEATLKP